MKCDNWGPEHQKIANHETELGAFCDECFSTLTYVLDGKPEPATVERAIRLLEGGAARLRQSPYALDDVMREIDEFWGVETGRLDTMVEFTRKRNDDILKKLRCDNCDGSGCPTCDPQEKSQE